MPPLSLKYKVVQSEGGDITVLACFADDIDAWLYHDGKISELMEEPGSQPEIWMEEWREDRWVLASKTDLNDVKLAMYDFKYSPEVKQLVHRRLTVGERDIIIRSMNLMLRQNKGALRSRSIHEFDFMFKNLDNREEDNKAWGSDEVKKLILEPLKQIERLEALIAFLRSREFIIESHLTIPELF